MFKLKLKKSFSLVLASIISSFSIFYVFASDPVTADSSSSSIVQPSESALDTALLKRRLQSSLGITASDVLETALPGIALVISDRGLYYASYDGKFFIQGKVYQIGETVTDLADASLSTIRLEGISKFKSDMIIYPAKNEKHVITVYTDITCGYCRKLHNQMDEYNAKGITVRYLPYPRSGIFNSNGELSQGFLDLRSIWCSENPNAALTKAKSGSKVAYRICDTKIEDGFNFARQIGINSTPAIIFENGMLVPGYQDPDKLSEMLSNM
ncbi:MAG: thiol:disulfide interchange protein DsbC [Alteromonadaceae bacterium]|jgi:thiol:disulfide interchange protein DsbC|tara:strand:- start:2987 stop:3793 length:807 start_codon:yes stop_codon:yes gene_type:complete